ncbi:hypothetical protein L210DRAFT_3577802 [Boletus edulis BED1]|uniref:Uncharacterized protein n=1 Tax=Boletus edulis BED1 TaxID=1328754 RepID=A0AAD4G6L1_BOLED|nr:hypothetical protein L210DRAFT_3577802 [Boletus edulis BED1]
MNVLLRNKGASKKSNVFYAVFNGIMIFLITVWVSTPVIFGQKMWILDPVAFAKENISAWYMDWGTSAVIILQLMMDGLMMHRCRIIWNSNRAIVVHVVLWLATPRFRSLVDWTSSSPDDNILCSGTCMICYRVLQHGRKIITLGENMCLFISLSSRSSSYFHTRSLGLPS